MQSKYEYLTKKEVIDNIENFRNQLRIELGKMGKAEYLDPNLTKFKFPLKNMETIISSIGHSFSIVNVGRCRYNLTIQN